MLPNLSEGHVTVCSLASNCELELLLMWFLLQRLQCCPKFPRMAPNFKHFWLWSNCEGIWQTVHQTRRWWQLCFPLPLRRNLCGLQNMKPNACKIWPFKVLAEPKHGEPNQATFDYAGKRLYIYADNNCNGLKYGNPTWEFSKMTLEEFAGIALGIYTVQRNSTRNSTRFGLQRF